MEKRIIVVSNRLPLKIVQKDGKWTGSPTSGGLVTGLNCAKENLNFLWMGSVEGVPEEHQAEVKEMCVSEFGFYPLFIEEDVYNKYYNHMCNDVFWPILHSFSDLVVFNTEDYSAYRAVNRQFCAALCEMAEDGDMVWVHDYHLMGLPEMLREECAAQIKVGFFLHIPFPSVSIISGFPLLYAMLRGVLGADLVAFHTFEYVGNFRNACALFGECSSPFQVQFEGRSVRVEAIPIGIDPGLFLSESLKETTKTRAEELKARFGNKKVILGIDRVDYIKGIPHRLIAFSRLLQKRPDLSGKVVFCQVGVPSRMDVKTYQVLSNTLCKLSGLVNSVGRIEETNVYFINNAVTFTELCALYLLSDVCVVSSLRDGMNLVSLEFIACAGSGALVMSDYAGATGMLIGSIQANPWSIEELSKTYEEALEMPEDERIKRKTSMQRTINEFSAAKWGERFIKILSSIGETDVSKPGETVQ
ncbi:trehalose 6-phosphate synthase [Nematocida sp. AWRm77]|nr:trehalose 6-phosphate synthase [Nematocida sp. AWRm77]